MPYQSAWAGKTKYRTAAAPWACVSQRSAGWTPKIKVQADALSGEGAVLGLQTAAFSPETSTLLSLPALTRAQIPS